jgi:hypothetical protein
VARVTHVIELHMCQECLLKPEDLFAIEGFRIGITGTDVAIFKIFSPKNLAKTLAKILAFFAQTMLC